MKKILFFLLFLIFSFLFSFEAKAAASLSLSPTSQNVATGQTFAVDINLNTGGTLTTGCDVILTFTPQIIKVKTVSFGTSPLYSDNNSTPDNSNGKLTLNSSVRTAVNGFNGTGKLATITFETVGTGSSAVSFICTPQTTAGDTNVWSDKGLDIVSCNANIGGTYTVTTSSDETTVTPTPEISDDITPTPTPPVAGNLSLTIFSGALGILFILFGLGMKFFLLRV